MVDSLDTSIILSYILGRDKQLEKVAQLLDSGAIHRIADLAITESVYVLEDHYSQTRAQIVENLQHFLKTFDDILDYNRELFDLAFPCYLKHPKLSFNDCCMAFYAEIGNAEPLFTFDKTLARQHPSAKLLS